MTWWDKLVKLWWEDEPKIFPTNPKVQHYYKVKYDVANKIKPKVMAEIGVRAGYSSFSFLSASPTAKMYAIDINKSCHGGREGVFIDVAPKILADFDVEFITANSQKIDDLPYDVDFIHIDGDHTYTGCMHDLEISKNHAEWILVDDYDLLKGVRKAVDEFVEKHPEYTSEYIDDKFRGNMLIHTAFRRDQS